MASEAQAMRVKQRHSAELLQRPGISGVGVEKDENGEFVLTVHVDPSQPEAARHLPAEIEGCPVKVVKSGPFKKLG